MSYQFFNKITNQYLFTIIFNKDLNINKQLLDKLNRYTGIIFNVDVKYKEEENY